MIRQKRILVRDRTNLYCIWFRLACLVGGLSCLVSGPLKAASTTAHKVGPFLKILQRAEAEQVDVAKPVPTNDRVAVVLKGEPVLLESIVTSVGGEVGTVAGTILTARIPRLALHTVLSAAVVERAEVEPQLVPINDRARQQVGADQVQRGGADLGIFLQS